MKSEVIFTIIDRENHSHELKAPLEVDLNLMEVCKAYELPVEGTCGGMALCASCHAYVESHHDLLERTEDEEFMLDQTIEVKDSSRLCCQIKVSEKVDGAVLKLAQV